MMAHLRSNVWFLVLSLFLCAVLYPAFVWLIAQTLFANRANGSLIVAKDGTVIGSRLIAQPFSDAYFQPRPSAANYNGAASAATNWGASNYLLRDRVARQLGPIVRYGPGAEKFGKKPGDGVQADIEAWFQSDRYQGQPGIVRQWRERHPGLALGKDLDTVWKGSEIQSAFFDMWRHDHPEVPLEAVPADMVTASASGLDPHITLNNARYQLKHRVATAQTEKIVAEHAEPLLQGNRWSQSERKEILAQVRKTLDSKAGGNLEANVHEEIEKLLVARREASLGGLAGVQIVNVLEINLDLRARMEKLAASFR